MSASLPVIAVIDPLSDPAWRLAWSTVLTFVGIGAGLAYARRPIKADHVSTWTKATIASVVVIGWMLMAYAIWPDAFIQFADANLLWTRDQFFWGDATGGQPFAVTKQAVRDVVVVVMYTVVGMANLVCFLQWQKRKPAEAAAAPAEGEAPIVKTSRFGRPIRKAAT